MLVSAFRSRVAQCDHAGFRLTLQLFEHHRQFEYRFPPSLPNLPFLYLLVAKTLDRFSIRRHRKDLATKKMFVVLAIVFILRGSLAKPARAYPHHLSYFNEIAGGPRNGYQYVTDSNYDWGQDLKNLKRWATDYNHCVLEKRTGTRDCQDLIHLATFLDQSTHYHYPH